MSAPRLRFKSFKTDWVEKPLSQISDIKTGPFGSALHEHDYVDQGTPIITVEHLGDGSIQHVNLPLVSQEDKTRLRSYLLKTEDIVFSRVGSVDRCCLVSKKEDGWLFSGRLLRLRVTDTNTSPSFLNQNFKTHLNKHRIRSVAVGQTMASLNTEILKKFTLYFPETHAEQLKISSLLSLFDEKITQLTKGHELLIQYKKGVMQKIFSQEIRFKDESGNTFPEWTSEAIGKIFKDLKGTSLSKEVLKEDGKHKCILYGELFTKYSEVIKTIFSRTDSTNGTPSKSGDLLMPSSTTTSAIDLAIASTVLEDGVLLGGDIIILRPNAPCDSQYMAYFITHAIKNELAKNAQGVTIIHMYFNKIKDVFLRVPCLEEQTKIANFLTAIDEKISNVQKQLELTKQYKQALLQQMFI
jgi:type I restriction enzyme, S subunit